ncbi:hypothetical protein FE257_001919 [Aspergillus nanangensis]|uniref:PRISE-like Rossmann-fold domain-containing protein n=1 Tax=Aspergillus nanangensis TaxID=2582783 RepID=A0AAD4CD52_ASPNN|nr:hypothetical protein FE257_001919 [Aspergillus nanangensis]
MRLRPLGSAEAKFIPHTIKLTDDEVSRLQHVPCDFFSTPNKIASALRVNSVTADYVFFYSYLQPKPKPGATIWSNAQELYEVNAALLRNSLAALPVAGLKPRRILLQTGAKYYGPHTGTIRLPAIESDLRSELEPNFYYIQEDLLKAHCQKEQTGWNVIRPSWVIGATTNAQMNAFYAFGVYAAVQAHLKKPMLFPGSFDIWQRVSFHSSAALTGCISEWAVLEEACKNKAFNSTDPHGLAWNRFWPELGRWFGVERLSLPPDEEKNMLEIRPNYGKNSPLGYGPPVVLRLAFSLTQWANDSEIANAWKEVMTKHGLTHDPFEDVAGLFPFADASLCNPPQLSMNKACRYGWTGYIDTIESIWVMFEEMNHLGMLPSMSAKDPRPCI